MSVEEKGTAALAAGLAMAMTRLRARIRMEAAAKSTAWTARWTWAQLATLDRIVENGPVTASELARAENVRQQSMSEILALLRADGLVRTERDPGDGRKALILATREGERIGRELKATRDDWLESVLREQLSDEERATVEAAVRIIDRLADGGK